MSEIIYGIHAIKSLLEYNPQYLLEVLTTKGQSQSRLRLLMSKLETIGVSIQIVSRKCLDNKAQGAAHQGIIARVRKARKLQEHDLPVLLKSIETPLLLVLDGVTDPHNLGACLRTADAAGVHALIVPRDRSAYLSPTTKKVACGAAENVPVIRVTNLVRTLHVLQEMNISLIGTTDNTTPTYTLYQHNMTGPLALIMGAEGKGMRRLTRVCCDTLISIPMTGIVSSLNVSVATGICLFEAIRQRSCPSNNLETSENYRIKDYRR